MIHKTNDRQTAHNSFKQCTKCGLEGNTKNCRILKSKRLLMPTVTSVKHNSTLPDSVGKRACFPKRPHNSMWLLINLGSFVSFPTSKFYFSASKNSVS